MRNKVIESVEKEKIIVIVRGIAKESLIPMTEAMYEGGVRLLEITYDATGKTPDEETAANIEMLAKHFEGRMFIGAGTVRTDRQVELTAKAGGGFIIPPDTNPAIINGSRKNRISKGSGRSIVEVNRLLKQFTDMQKMLKGVQQMSKNPKLMRRR